MLTSLIGGQRLVFCQQPSAKLRWLAVRGVGPVQAGQRPASTIRLPCSLPSLRHLQGFLRFQPPRQCSPHLLTFADPIALLDPFEPSGQIGIQQETVQPLDHERAVYVGLHTSAREQCAKHVASIAIEQIKIRIGAALS